MAKIINFPEPTDKSEEYKITPFDEWLEFLRQEVMRGRAYTGLKAYEGKEGRSIIFEVEIMRN